MSDEQRRELERRVAASPGDFVAGHELVRAFERAGEAAKARSELARMARAREPDAWRRVARLSAPKPARFRIGERDGVADPASCRVVVSEPFERDLVLAASDEALLVTSRSGTVAALDPRTLERVFREQCFSFNGAAVSRVFAWGSREGLRVRGLDFDVTRRGGEEVCALTAGFERIAFAVRGRRGMSVVGVLDTRGDPLWEQSVSSEAPQLAIAGDRLVCAKTRDGKLAIDVLSLESGERVFERLVVASHIAAADAAGVFVRGVGAALELDLETGVERALGGLGNPKCSRERVVVFDSVVLLGFARGEAGVLWRAALRGEGTTSFAIAGEHVWWATVVKSHAVVGILDARDGTEIRRERFSLQKCWEPLWISLDGAMLLVVGLSGGVARVIRFEPA